MEKKKKLVVLTGAGMSAESGIPVFRGNDGLWENHSIEDVATPMAWQKNFRRVLHFYNQRRKQIYNAQPNRGHKILTELEKYFEVVIITQNVDDLHERAGSNFVLHLHGEITKARSTEDPSLIYELKHWEMKEGDLCELGSQLRPDIVWFGEAVPMIEPAEAIMQVADIVVVVGTSLQVYPAAGLIQSAPTPAPKYIIDPEIPQTFGLSNVITLENTASEGLEKLKVILLA